MGATENAKVRRNLGLDFVAKQHKSLQNFSHFSASVSDMLTSLLSLCYSATWQVELNEHDSVCLMTKKYDDPRLKMLHSGCALM